MTHGLPPHLQTQYSFCYGNGFGTGTDDFTAKGSNRMSAKVYEHILCVQIQPKKVFRARRWNTLKQLMIHLI